jgi:hypothetical protein
MRPILLIPFILTLAGCAMGNKPQGFVPPKESVKGLSFGVAPENLGQSFGKAETRQLASQIARNLHSWGFPVSAADEPGSEGATHSLEGRVGQITHKSTPPGMSFTLGNSDPRALEFQKADVVPITCALANRSHPRDVVTLTGEFAVEFGLDDLIGRKSARTPMDYYVDRIGTVCLNLLLELKIERPKQAAATPGEPTWIPEVRIEVRDKPDAAPHPSAVQAATPVAPALEREAPSENAIRTETTQKESDTRKQVIIHNRGVPVILEFGYERK